MNKILQIENRTFLVLKKLDQYGPEEHLECLYKNRKVILVNHPSGKIGYLKTNHNSHFHTSLKGIFYCHIKGVDNSNILYADNCFHREENLPAIIGTVFNIMTSTYDDYFEYIFEGKFHRTNGPAKIDGKIKRYYVNGKEFEDPNYSKEAERKYQLACLEFCVKKVFHNK